MHRGLVKTFVAGLVAVGLTSLPARSHAKEGAGEASHHEEAHEKGQKPTSATAVGEVWHKVKAEEAELSHLVQTEELDRVHKKAYAIRDLVAQLPEKSQQLSLEHQTKLKSNVKYVATLAGRLDQAGDAKDKAKTEATFKQLQSVLASIEALYPPETLK
jgi:hypothetical protein